MAFLRKLINSKMGRAGAVLAFFTLLSKLVGLFRDRILAGHFGASTTLDIYYSAFKIPDFIFNLLILGAVSAAIIPVFIEHRNADDKKGWRMIENVTTAGFYAVLAVSAVVFMFADYFAVLVAPGIIGADRLLLIKLLRLMLLSPIIFSISAVMGSILQALERFVAYSIAPIMYNIGIIIGAIWFAPWLAARGYHEVFGLGLGVILGALLHMVVQAVPVAMSGFRFHFKFNSSEAGLRKIVRLMIPRTLALGTYSVGVIIINAFASALGTGAITILNLVINVQYLPTSILGISVATAIFPRMSDHASRGEWEQFKFRLNQAMKSTAWLVTLFALAMFLLRKPFVDILFRVGSFSSADAQATATLLGIFMFGVTAQSLMHIITRAYYALQNTRTPFWVAFWSILLNILLCYIFVFPLHRGLIGIGIAQAISYNVNFLALYLLFRKRYK